MYVCMYIVMVVPFINTTPYIPGRSIETRAPSSRANRDSGRTSGTIVHCLRPSHDRREKIEMSYGCVIFLYSGPD